MPSSRTSVYFQNVGVFTGLFAAFHRAIHHLDPAQPFDPHVAFPTRNDKAHWIPVLFTQSLAIGLERGKHIVQRLFHRDRAAVRGRIRAFDINPRASGIVPGLFQQNPQGNAGIFHIVDHAVGELRPVQLCTGPFHAGIGRAFAEIDMVFTREPFQIHSESDSKVYV